MQRATTYQSLYFHRIFGYDDAAHILPKLVLLFEFLDRRCRAHPAKVGILSRFLDMTMQRISCQSWYFVEGFFI